MGVIMLNRIQSKLKNLADVKRAKISKKFFKTGPGEYGEGDLFLGIRVPVLRKIAKEYEDVEHEVLKSLLNSPVHEERLLSLFILIRQYQKGSENKKKKIFKFFINNTRFINNWDLVDLSAPNIVGDWLIDKSKNSIYKMAKSKSMWERRISIVATFSFIKNGMFSDTLEITEILLNDKEDLIHKAAGWMLREVGKRDVLILKSFIKEHYANMPRTMLRYAIEKFPEPERQAYLKGNF